MDEISELKAALKYHAPECAATIGNQCRCDPVLNFVRKQESTTAEEVAKHFGLSVQGANNRLKRLYIPGLLAREPIVIPRGGRAYLYTAN